MEGKKYGRLLPVRCDVKEEKDIKSAFKKSAEVFSSIDVCVNNAGLAHSAPLLTGSTEEWKEMLDVSVGSKTKEVLDFSWIEHCIIITNCLHFAETIPVVPDPCSPRIGAFLPVPINFVAVPGNFVAVPGNFVAVPGNFVAVPGNFVAVPGNFVAVPGNFVAVPGNFVAVPGNFVAVPGNFVAVPVHRYLIFLAQLLFLTSLVLLCPYLS